MKTNFKKTFKSTTVIMAVVISLSACSDNKPKVEDTKVVAEEHNDAKFENKNDFRKTAEAALLSRYTPPSVVVNEQMDVVHINGQINPFLETPQGKPTFNLLKMAREGLAFELRNTLHKAKTTNALAIKEGVLVKSKEEIIQVNIDVLHCYSIILHLHFVILRWQIPDPP